ncbi:hypothetical protein MMC25_004941 [Agyrium rufum]|nr:hypothetical protein [Agyrium rufum]
MPSALQTATTQAAVLNITSSVLAQLLTAYRSGGLPGEPSLLNPLGLDFVPIVHFLIYSLLSTPPNYLWQQYLEKQFPGYPTGKRKQKIKVDDDGKGVIVEKKLDLTNTAIKFLLDQSLGALVNTVAFLTVIKALRGGSPGECIRTVQTELWPIMTTAYKLWPLVSVLNFTVVPVERRVVVGSMVGLGWGVYMALRSARIE